MLPECTSTLCGLGTVMEVDWGGFKCLPSSLPSQPCDDEVDWGGFVNPQIGLGVPLIMGATPWQ